MKLPNVMVPGIVISNWGLGWVGESLGEEDGMTLTDGRDDMSREGIADGKIEGDALGTSVGDVVGSAVTVSITTELYREKIKGWE